MDDGPVEEVPRRLDHKPSSSENTLAGERDTDRHGDHDAEKQEPAPRGPVGFWSADLSQARRKVFTKWSIMVAILCVFILLVLSLFWGALCRASLNSADLKVYLVNFDSNPDAFVGKSLINVFLKHSSDSPDRTLGFQEMTPSTFNNDPLKIREAVYYEEAYAAVIVNANASTLLRQAIETGNSSYDPMGIAQIIYNEARDQETYYGYIYPIMNQLSTQAIQQFGQSWTQQVMSNSTLNNAQTLAKVPQALSPAVAFSIFNLRPFWLPVAVPAVSIGLIYLIIISFFSFGFFMPIHSIFMNAKEHRPLKFRQWVIWRWVSCVAAYFIMSLAYSLVSLAFQIPFDSAPQPADEVHIHTNGYGRASFFIYWMVNFLGMWALGMACENMAMVVGLPWTSMWLVFWVITNVATGFYSLELEPRFFYWGYAWPLRNIVQASRTILFDTRSYMGRNIGVLVAWAVVNSLLYPAAAWVARWKIMRTQKKMQ